MRKKSPGHKKNPLALFIFLTAAFRLLAQYPEIIKLNTQDLLFRQMQKDLSQYYVAAARGDGQAVPPLLFFTYERKQEEDLFFLAARFNLPYECLATLNRAENVNEFNKLKKIIIPNLPGVFVPLEARYEVEKMMITLRRGKLDRASRITVVLDNRPYEYYFFIGEKFDTFERAYFLRILFRFPLPGGTVTSYFGERPNPFTKEIHFHSGIDIAAPAGTDVLAAREGIVIKASWDDTLGNYIIISHAGGYQTVYGHLSLVNVVLNQEVYSGMIIGKVGNTGLSTGPHLHFEIRKDGKPLNPEGLLLKGNRK